MSFTMFHHFAGTGVSFFEHTRALLHVCFGHCVGRLQKAPWPTQGAEYVSIPGVGSIRIWLFQGVFKTHPEKNNSKTLKADQKSMSWMLILHSWNQLVPTHIPADGPTETQISPLPIIQGIFFLALPGCALAPPPRIVYLFPYESTRDQGIPHDLQIMHELWAVERYQAIDSSTNLGNLDTWNLKLTAKAPKNRGPPGKGDSELRNHHF